MGIDNKNRAEEKEEVKNAKKNEEMSERQLESIDKRLDKAVKEGVLRRKDRAKVYARLDGLPKNQKKDAEKIVEEYVEVKRGKRNEYIEGKKQDKEYIGLDQAVKKGLISLSEKKILISNYDRMSGEDRKKEAEENLPKLIEQKKLEKKEFRVLLEESPHFSKNNQLTTEGKRLLKDHDNMSITERERKVLKLRLIRKLEKLDNFSVLCKERYKMAGEYYKRGEYEIAVNLMKKNIKTCKRYPESARLEEYKKFAQWDANNGQYEALKNRQIIEKREEVRECFKGKDAEGGVQCANEAVEMTKKFIMKTYDGRNGEYQEGSSIEKERDQKWITPYMKNMMNKVNNEKEIAQKSYEKLFKEEAEEEERILNEENEIISNEQAKDIGNQARIKAATDTIETLQEDKKDENENFEKKEEKTEKYSTHEEGIDSKQTVNEDKEEDEEVEEALWTKQEDKDVYNIGEDEKKEEIERIDGKGNIIDEERDGTIKERDAEELLNSREKLKTERGNRSLTDEEEVKKQLSESLQKNREKTIQELKKSGRISKERSDEHMNSIDVNMGGKVIDEQKRSGDVIDFKQRETTTRKLKNIFIKTKTKNKNTLSKNEIIKRNKEKKKEQAKRAV